MAHCTNWHTILEVPALSRWGAGAQSRDGRSKDAEGGGQVRQAEWTAGHAAGGHRRPPNAGAGRENYPSPKGRSPNTGPGPGVTNGPNPDPKHNPEGAHEHAEGRADKGVHTGDKHRGTREPSPKRGKNPTNCENCKPSNHEGAEGQRPRSRPIREGVGKSPETFRCGSTWTSEGRRPTWKSCGR